MYTSVFQYQYQSSQSLGSVLITCSQAGIFITIGAAAATSGAGLLISLLIASFAALMSAMCHAEFGASLPVPGSTYSYVYASFGELIGWLYVRFMPVTDMPELDGC